MSRKTTKSDVRGLLQRAFDLHGAGRLDAAAPLYRKVLKADPRNPVALHLSGLIAHQRGKHAHARELIEKALAERPDYAEAHNNLGLVLSALGEIENAEAAHRAAIAAKPDLAEAHNNLGIALQAQGRGDEALAAFDAALRLNPMYAEAHSNRADALRGLGRRAEAARAAAQAVTLSPGDAKMHYNLGVARKDAGDLVGASESYRAALELDPKSTLALNNLGNILQDLGRLDEALDCYEAALALDPTLPRAQNNKGNILQELDRTDEALACYDAALTARTDRGEVERNRAGALATLGRRDEAIAAYRSALAENPNDGDAYRLLSGLKSFKAGDDDIAAMEALHGRVGAEAPERMHVAYGLAKAYHDLGDYDRAFGYLAEGSALRRRELPYSTDDDVRTFDILKRTVTPAYLAARADGGVADGAPIFIVGMPRSGTTLVEQILASHPAVCGGGELKELKGCVVRRFGAPGGDAFAGNLAAATADDYTGLGRDYLDLTRRLHPVGGQTHFTDKMPGNFQFVGLLRLALPRAKIIHCRRDARDTCLSNFRTYFAEDGLAYSYDLAELGRYHRLYDDLMAHWRAVLPDSFFEVEYESLVADQEGGTRALLDYCGLDWDDACLEFHKTERRVNTASWNQVRQPIHAGSVRAWKRYESHLGPLIDALG